MKNEKTIFEVLFEKEICFAVSASLNRLDEGSRDYFLIVQEQDLKYLKNMNFERTDDYANVFERDLSADEIKEFKTNMDKFVEVQHNQFGRVYELKNNSFKKLYERNKLATQLILTTMKIFDEKEKQDPTSYEAYKQRLTALIDTIEDTNEISYKTKVDLYFLLCETFYKTF